MPATPRSANASRTSSNLNGLTMAMIIFIGRFPLGICGQDTVDTR
jgi:hypothetical protein